MFWARRISDLVAKQDRYGLEWISHRRCLLWRLPRWWHQRLNWIRIANGVLWCWRRTRTLLHSNLHVRMGSRLMLRGMLMTSLSNLRPSDVRFLASILWIQSALLVAGLLAYAAVPWGSWAAASSLAFLGIGQGASYLRLLRRGLPDAEIRRIQLRSLRRAGSEEMAKAVNSDPAVWLRMRLAIGLALGAAFAIAVVGVVWRSV